MSLQLARLAGLVLRLLRLFRRHHIPVAMVTLLVLVLFAALDYGYKVHGCDLLWWFSQVAPLNISPLSVLLHIACAKVTVILGLALGSYIRSAVVKELPALADMPISFVRRRYCHFIVMRLLASLDELVLEPESMDLKDYIQRHARLSTAVELFRCQARKVFERTDQQVTRPLHEILVVDDRLEMDLVHRGYGKCVRPIREWDIHRMIYDGVA